MSASPIPTLSLSIYVPNNDKYPYGKADEVEILTSSLTPSDAVIHKKTLGIFYGIAREIAFHLKKDLGNVKTRVTISQAKGVEIDDPDFSKIFNGEKKSVAAVSNKDVEKFNLKHLKEVQVCDEIDRLQKEKIGESCRYFDATSIRLFKVLVSSETVNLELKPGRASSTPIISYTFDISKSSERLLYDIPIKNYSIYPPDANVPGFVKSIFELVSQEIVFFKKENLKKIEFEVKLSQSNGFEILNQVDPHLKEEIYQAINQTAIPVKNDEIEKKGLQHLKRVEANEQLKKHHKLNDVEQYTFIDRISFQLFLAEISKPIRADLVVQGFHKEK